MNNKIEIPYLTGIKDVRVYKTQLNFSKANQGKNKKQDKNKELVLNMMKLI